MTAFITSEKIAQHSEILSNRIRKRYLHLKKRFARKNIDCFRLYDWDIPEIRLVIDWYAGHLVIAEDVRKQSSDYWLKEMANVIGKTLDVPKEKIYIKKRRTKTENEIRYSRIDSKEDCLVVNEGDLRFKVNLSDFLDTGLYSDHRETRAIVKKNAEGKDFLNLFSYTGAFTCAAALGGAVSSISVDRSDTNVTWAKDNLKLNGINTEQHIMVKSDVYEFLFNAAKEKRRFSLAVIDPPSFFKDNAAGKSFDVNEDHPDLIKKVLKLMAPRSIVFFSTNHQCFEPRMDNLPIDHIHELTPRTIPEDYRNKNIHKCWKLFV
ncbi:MAG: SAM-dependent methyltransferase [Omnitrophica WOR_2 bacterium GWA2_37_7]|nr:MAG: SAM-dependent methyltransferase [Omnitrophica WOR_2 bacterium GWA2_37_7]